MSYYDCDNPLERSGHFKVCQSQGREYLVWRDKRIATAHNGYERLHGGLQGWLKKIKKRTLQRRESINQQIGTLQSEDDGLFRLTLDLNLEDLR